MKKTANLSKIALLVLSLLLLVTAFASFTGCIGSSSGQATLEATEDELKMEPQLRRIGVQTLPSAQVNKQTGAALFYYAGETNNIKPGDEGYENLTFTVTLTDENNNDISLLRELVHKTIPSGIFCKVCERGEMFEGFTD